LNAQPEPVPIPIYQPLIANQLAAQFPSDNNEQKRLARLTPEIRLRDIALLLAQAENQRVGGSSDFERAICTAARQ
jgi:hypothetical protein